MHFKDSFRVRYHTYRAIKNPEKFAPSRLLISKCKWHNNADSPVVFMVDDLTNAWFDKNENGRLDVGEDWGYGKYHKNSILSFLEEQLLKRFPDVKVTFFTVVGKMSTFSQNSQFTHSERIDEDRDTITFFNKLYNDKRFEIAYHGLNHGRPGDDNNKFIQEWLCFPSLQAGIDQIKQGMKIYKKVLGKNPAGGKYGGYSSNDFSDDSIDECNFKYWCRNWYPEQSFDIQNRNCFELSYFGKNKIVDIPSNIHGFWWTKKQITALIKNRQVIAIQEHIAPYRVDGKVQCPNIVDDINRLRKLFRLLLKQNIWYATCSELADYFIAFNDSLIYDVKKNSFRMKYWGRTVSPFLSLLIDARSICDAEKPYVRIILPDNSILDSKNSQVSTQPFLFLISIPLMDGFYKVESVSQPTDG